MVHDCLKHMQRCPAAGHSGLLRCDSLLLESRFWPFRGLWCLHLKSWELLAPFNTVSHTRKLDLQHSCCDSVHSPVNWIVQSLLKFADTVLTETRCHTKPFFHLCAIVSVRCGNASVMSVFSCFSSVWSASVLLPRPRWLLGQQGCHITHHHIQGTLWKGWGLHQTQTCVQVMCLDCLIVGSLLK